MRKFYLFTLALLCAVGAWAQGETVEALTRVGETAITAPMDGGKYVIKCSGQNDAITWMYDNGIGGVKATNQTECPLGVDAKRYVWTATITDGGTTYKFTNLLTNKQITFNGNYNGSNVSTSANGTAITIEKSGDNVGLKNSNGQYIDMGYYGTSAETWSGSVEGSRVMTIYEATISSTEDYAKVVYNYQLKEGITRKTSDPVIVDLGASYPAATGLPRGVTATLPEGTVSLDGADGHVVTKDVLCTQRLPFEAFKSVDDISKWYYVKMHANSTRTRYIREATDFISFPYSDNGTEDNLIFENNENHNSALWGFVGDAFGMKLVSKSGNVVVFTGSGVASFSDNEADGTDFVLTANVYNSNDWFCMKHPTLTEYLNADSNNRKVSHWSENDNGSSMQVEEEKTDDDVNGLVSQMADLEPFEILEGSTVQGPSEFANPTEINVAISDFKTESVASGTLLKKRAFLHSSNGQKLINYVNQVATYGSLANIQFEMQAQYGTLIMPCPSSAVAGLKTYRCSGVDANNVVTLALNGTNGGGALAQEVPYIIEATPGAKFTIIGWDKGSRETHTDDNGYLTGVLADEGANIPMNSYVLAKNKEGKVGFFKVTGNNVTCPQYKCYLNVTSNARAFYFSSDDVETGINAVEIEEATPANAVIYDLSGRRVQSAKSGLYIVNGKKVIK